MTEEINIKKAKKNYGQLVMLFTIAILVGLVFYVAGMSNKYKTHIRTLEIELGDTLQKTTKEIIELKTVHKKTVEEFDKLKNDLQNIKDKDDLMRRDIQLYIKSRYRSVPNVVAQTISENTVKLGKKYEVSIPLLVGIMQVESITFNPMALSKKGAIGLMQVMPEWVPKLGLKNKYELYNIDTNIESGIKVLKIHIDEAKGSITKGLYLYVNKDTTYADKVYTAVGQFVTYRSTVDNEKINNGNGTIKKVQEQSKKSEVANEHNPK